MKNALGSNLARDLLCPRINIRPLAIVARVAAEGFEQQPRPCGPVVEINHSREDTIVAGMKCLFGSNGEQPHGILRERCGVLAHDAFGFGGP